MKNVLKNILFSFCFTEQREIRAISPFIYSCARKKTVNGNRGGEDEEKKENKELSLGERRKKGKGEEVRMGVA